MQITFQYFFNQKCNDYKNNLRNGLFGHAYEALSAMRDCLHSDRGNQIKGCNMGN